MIVSKNVEFYRSRLLDLADLLESLPEENFNHSSFTSLDTYECKTSACVAGWAVLLHSDIGKEVNSITKEIMSILSKNKVLTLDLNRELSMLQSKRTEIYYKINWDKEGKVILGLGEETGEKLFYPLNDFWNSLDTQCVRGATAKQAALVMRCIAYTKDFRLRYKRFNEKAMTKFVEKHRSA